ncbi:MAG: pyridoxine 5'-phosphate synthase [Schleiferiaceae bacterium]
MTQLSVNINKIATLRNARGGDVPNVIEVAKDCEKFGAQGITVHPRPDERHITYKDVRELSQVVTTEFNIEGYPTNDFIDLVTEVKPAQVTLVPDSPEVLTSNAGWDTVKHLGFLKEVVSHFNRNDIRTSLFVETNVHMIEGAKASGTDRIELYTESYAKAYPMNPEIAVNPFTLAAKYANTLGLGVNAGHDLSLENLAYFASHVPELLEVSIGHALISDALYYGLENTIQMYRGKLQGTVVSH